MFPFTTQNQSSTIRKSADHSECVSFSMGNIQFYSISNRTEIKAQTDKEALLKTNLSHDNTDPDKSSKKWGKLTTLSKSKTT